MLIGDKTLGYVIDRAARVHIAQTGDGIAETHERCRAWWEAFKPTVMLWLQPPAVYDVRSLMYRRLMAHLSGKAVWREPCDNKALGYVIGAGNGWDELPTREAFWPDDTNEAIVFAYFGVAYEGEQAELTAQRRTLATIQKWE